MFPQKFLMRMAQTHQLSADQESVFLLRFGEDREDREVASFLGISEEAYRKRMGEIYRKFDISGKGPGKNNRLLHILQNFLDAETSSQNEQNLFLATQSISSQGVASDINIEELVQQLRHRSRQLIQERCATMRVLDMSHPIDLENIYTGTDVLEKITSRRRLGIADFLATYHGRDRIEMGLINEDRISSMEALNRYSKLMLLGKPGAGKTTLLKYTALKCSQGDIFSDLVPIFVTLRQYAGAESQPLLLDYISQDLCAYNISNEANVKQLLQQGRAILFLDGLDEVRENDLHRVLEDLRSFSEQFYTNRFVITSRLGSQEYIFEKFTEVEVANFQPLQISQFAQRWFLNNSRHIEIFLRKVEDNRPIQELATNPLLLTLLCLVFDEFGDFPTNRSELYREGLDVLLKKWDAKRNIERHQIYKNLSMQRKEDLLAQVACTTFYQGDYFFRQVDLESYITEYIRNLPKANTDEDALQLDSAAIIRAIESQHGLFVERAKGIYSFSHLTFHEYLAAREFVYNGSQDTLTLLATKITDQRWHDILRLAVGMMRSADELLILMKEYCDRLLASDPQLQSLLQWVNQKAESVQVTDRIQSVRAFYLTLGRAIAQSSPHNLANVLARSLVLDLDLCQNRNLNVDLAFDLARALETKDGEDLGLDLELDLSLALEYAQEAVDSQLADALTELIEACPEDADSEIKWEDWANNLRQQTINNRNIGQIWNLTPHQLEHLRQYCNANRLLVECLESDCYVRQPVRQAIEQSLLLPITHSALLSNPNQEKF
ncbi:MAG: NACHT C-terminal helical domain 2-containing protein [Pseudanabaena sp.]|jgi:predicted NACHT family NTPase|nr:NACHT domain-containing protein [Pseudanabaena sp. M090S1SP2A07QC]MCA6504895.1 NACHT domain-containing protein [Pseudanabaena sp. M172S2SP2A07QC]MCA6511052.1 NACHT domain-containing protein [Pseudanabaena sp. M109S1SP2A07QC]MCA6522134.1 NACHT domain-containing protein [Pseudanabaena sp. M051S1SP2A07QC]MCA6524728.1 NACHT domain-containing protein [Pseudanabaena sp. M179S2SP2A07QC]MCA6528903.1 NACHT domain-containing protein [Pseudanabaena sp. M125S2SP2A07QC]MCA6534735.1 NACHT domain-contain